MNEANRTAIVLLAAAWIVLMAIVIFLAWAAPDDVINTLGDVSRRWRITTTPPAALS